jgi:hypothetical protein
MFSKGITMNVDDFIELKQLLEQQPVSALGFQQINVPFSPYPAHDYSLHVRLAVGNEHVVEGWDIVVSLNDVVTPLARENVSLWLNIAKLALQPQA